MEDVRVRICKFEVVERDLCPKMSLGWEYEGEGVPQKGDYVVRKNHEVWKVKFRVFDQREGLRDLIRVGAERVE